MAERIASLGPVRVGSTPLYPWDEWMDGSAWRIRRGEDFAVPVKSMASMIRIRGNQFGVGASARIVDENTVEFQFEAPLDEAA